jgi:deoxycytidine triphosphate deaminase
MIVILVFMRLRKGWKRIVSPDLKVESIGIFGGKLKSSHLVLPGQFVEATVKPRLSLHPGHIPDISTRSIIARHGVQVGFNQSHINEILAEGKLPRTVNLLHMGSIPLRLRRGNRIGRVYYPQMISPLRGQEISKLKSLGKLSFGKDFRVFPNGRVEIRVQPVVHELKSNPKEVVKTNWVSGSKRKEFMKHFERKKKDVKVKLGGVVLTETLPVKLPKDVGLFLQSSTGGNSIHIRSLLIDPGYEGPIVLELMGVKEGARPDKILAYFVRPSS